ncbi:MAG: tetratricopeptide repeat protein [Calditrichaeota bacterium]|nr:tetratricopeptide repeat protein [Calditrichota bacterium]
MSIKQLKQFNHKYPESALAEEVHFLQGECYFYLGRYEEAIQKYQAHIEAYPVGTAGG